MKTEDKTDKTDKTNIVGYRLLEKDEKINDGDVCGWARKMPIDMANWKGEFVKDFNQPVFRPMSSFVDKYKNATVA